MTGKTTIEEPKPAATTQGPYREAGSTTRAACGTCGHEFEKKTGRYGMCSDCADATDASYAEAARTPPDVLRRESNHRMVMTILGAVVVMVLIAIKIIAGHVAQQDAREMERHSVSP